MRFWILISALLITVACGKKEVRNEISEEKQPVELLKYGDQFYAEGDYENAFRAYGIIYYNFPTSREYIDAALGLRLRCDAGLAGRLGLHPAAAAASLARYLRPQPRLNSSPTAPPVATAPYTDRSARRA